MEGRVAGGTSGQANVTLRGVDVNEKLNGSAFARVLRAPLGSV